MSPRGFAVVDLETTGLFPGGSDRIVEVAVVHLDSNGAITDRWHSLVHPDRDLGATHVHGLTGRDLQLAPRFEEIADELLERLDRRVLVAHNASFDVRFLAAEFTRIGVLSQPEFPAPHLCTMRLAARLTPGTGRKLADCCSVHGIEIDGAHSALGDAEATARLLAACLASERIERHLDLDSVGVVRGERFGRIGRRGLPVARAAAAALLAPLARVAGRAGNGSVDDAERDYLALLDRVLEDALLTVDEAGELHDLARGLGIGEARRRQLHSEYFLGVADEIWADGELTQDEHSQLRGLHDVLALNAAHLDAALEPRTADGAATGADAPDQLRSGDLVVLTGTMSRPKSYWEERLDAAGCTVQAGVTKRTTVVVAADPTSLSGKAKKARQYGIPIVGEDWLTGQLDGLWR